MPPLTAPLPLLHPAPPTGPDEYLRFLRESRGAENLDEDEDEAGPNGTAKRRRMALDEESKMHREEVGRDERAFVGSLLNDASPPNPSHWLHLPPVPPLPPSAY